MDKPAIDFIKLNEAFLSSKQSFDFPNSCPSSHFLGLYLSYCLWMGIRHFLRLLPFLLAISSYFNRDKPVKANFATCLFPETTGKVLLTCNYGYVTYNIYVERKKRVLLSIYFIMKSWKKNLRSSPNSLGEELLQGQMARGKETRNQGVLRSKPEEGYANQQWR